MDLQIDEFYKDAAAAMLLLYQAFPRKVALYVEDLIGREEPDDFGLPSQRHQNCLGALLWLAEEGYLRFDSCIAYDALDQAVLSEKGFLRLTRALPLSNPDQQLTPSILRVQATLAYQLREALGSRQSERVALLTQHLFVSGLTGQSDANDTV
ncbi:MAG: hypothetical protein K2X80_15635 [Pseudomonadaceae bacterium]|nr:hypothetical protein [Pseudomonadaceae bacterium]